MKQHWSRELSCAFENVDEAVRDQIVEKFSQVSFAVDF